MTKAAYETEVKVLGQAFKFEYHVSADNINVTEEEHLRVYHVIKEYILDELSDHDRHRFEWVRTGHSELGRKLFIAGQMDLLSRTAGLSPNLRALLGSLISN